MEIKKIYLDFGKTQSDETFEVWQNENGKFLKIVPLLNEKYFPIPNDVEIRLDAILNNSIIVAEDATCEIFKNAKENYVKVLITESITAKEGNLLLLLKMIKNGATIKTQSFTGFVRKDPFVDATENPYKAVGETNEFLKKITTGNFPEPSGLDYARMEVVETSLANAVEKLRKKWIGLPTPPVVDALPNPFGVNDFQNFIDCFVHRYVYEKDIGTVNDILYELLQDEIYPPGPISDGLQYGYLYIMKAFFDESKESLIRKGVDVVEPFGINHLPTAIDSIKTDEDSQAVIKDLQEQVSIAKAEVKAEKARADEAVAEAVKNETLYNELYDGITQNNTELNLIFKDNTTIVKCPPFKDGLKPTTLSNAFNGCTTLEEIPTPIDVSETTSVERVFDNCINLKATPLIGDFSKCKVFDFMYSNCKNIEEFPPLYIPEGVTRTRALYMGCEKLTKLPEMNYEQIEVFHEMFCQTNLEGSVTLNASNASNCRRVFGQCRYITECTIIISEKCTDLSSALECEGSALKTLNILGDTSNAIMQRLLSKCEHIETFYGDNLVFGKNALFADPYTVYWVTKLKNINPIRIESDFYLATTPVLTLESAKAILTALVDYSGTDEEFTYTVTLHSAVWDLLDADGETSPTGTTWGSFAMAKGWNI